MPTLNPGVSSYPHRLAALGWTCELHIRGALGTAPRAVAIVGARAATHVTMDRAYELARQLAERGVDIISGGALGIDGAAHRGALAGHGTTTVVLGCGVDVAYPARHADLFDQIIRANGALVSMLPDGTQPRRGTFPQRNPLIAALADVVVVAHADVKSGSLSTARAARELGRIVVAFPGSAGCDHLLATGAAIADPADAGVADVQAALDGRPRMPRPAVVVDDDPIAARICEAIAAGARTTDAIVTATGLPVRAVLRALPLIERYS